MRSQYGRFLCPAVFLSTPRRTSPRLSRARRGVASLWSPSRPTAQPIRKATTTRIIAAVNVVRKPVVGPKRKAAWRMRRVSGIMSGPPRAIPALTASGTSGQAANGIGPHGEAGPRRDPLVELSFLQEGGDTHALWCRVYCASPPYAPPVRLAIQPQGGGTTAVVEGLVGGIVLHIRLPGAGHHGGVRVHIVLLLGHIALKLINELLARLQVPGAPLFLEQGRERRVVDIAPVSGWSGTYILYDGPSGSRAMLGPYTMPSYLPCTVVAIYAPYSCSFNSTSMPTSLRKRCTNCAASTRSRPRPAVAVSCVFKPLGYPASASRRLASLGSY